MKLAASLTGLAALLPALVSAHGYVDGVFVDGVWHDGVDPLTSQDPESAPPTIGWISKNLDWAFIETGKLGEVDINCYKSALPGKKFLDVNPGQDITISWNQWPGSHQGPIINYLSPYAATPDALQWTKIDQAGIVNDTDRYGALSTWVTDVLIANNESSIFTVPQDLAPGDYVLRHEIIALHYAVKKPYGTQLYPQCLNLRVGGTGVLSLPEGTPGTSLYSSEDAGLNYDLYSNPGPYPFPGPEVWAA